MIGESVIEPTFDWDSMAHRTEETSAAIDADSALMLRFKRGEAQAFELLFSRHLRGIVNFAYRFVRNREVAEELAQEVFLRVYEASAGYRPEAKFTSWIYRIATNVCLNEIRKPRFRALHQSLDADPADQLEKCAEGARNDEPDKLLHVEAISRILREALDEVPEKQRVAFILNKYQELSYAEVAEAMRISEKAVKSLIHRAKETLAQRLKPLLPELMPQ